MTIDERIDRLIRVAEGHQAQIDAHDAQIDALISIDEQRAEHMNALISIDEQRAEHMKLVDRRIENLTGISERLLASAEKHEKAIANLEKQWQAYLNTLPRN